MFTELIPKALLIRLAYNEEELLKSAIDKVKSEIPDIDFLVVNNGSKDGAAQVCRANYYFFLDFL